MYFEIIIAYLLGSIPFGLILSNYFGNGNLRTSGSGNIGATNVVRTQGKVLGTLTFLLDGIKGLIPFLVFNNISNPTLVFLAVIFGHMFPIWLKFRGGKGIATFFGALLGLHSIISVIAMISWGLIFKLTRISSISGLGAVTLGSIMFFIAYQDLYNIWDCIAFAIVPLVIFIKHYDNILRLVKHKEETI